MVLDGAVKAPSLLRFFARLVRDAGQKIFLILDRLPVHRSAKVRAWLAGREAEIEVFHLPPYSPEPSGQCPIGANFRGSHGIAPCRTGSFGVGAVAPGCGGRGWRLRQAALRRSTRHARR
jgi:hypothetical protein